MSAPRLSFEFFPPQSLEASFRLWDTVRTLSPLAPEFVSVTYGAGGTTRDLTHDAVKTIHNHYGLNVAAHLTCVEATKAETMEICDRYAEAGVTEIVALRGDPPKGAGAFTPHPDGFADSCELISALADTGKFKIRVGAYPDPHPEAASDTADIDWLKRKIDAGATSAITQFFFEADTFFRFRDRCAAAGIDAQIIPGILPVENWKGVKKFADRCGAHVPQWVIEAFEKAERDDRHDLLAVSLCSELCTDLLEGGVEDLHFYTLNKPHLTREVAHALGVVPQATLRDVA
ncbi:methylenetetrahydrofolate reductase [NAD(P)H] [Psychromarinibacter sp. S121]|uniref:methylenetetrahydrofolate reductase [NAD(P)H] n=1 Tax=Psychromarinibacter sp. S121 TaxID=3415127 RepID=UPI003C7AD456